MKVKTVLGMMLTLLLILVVFLPIPSVKAPITETFISSTSDGFVSRSDASYTTARNSEAGENIDRTTGFIVIGQYGEVSPSTNYYIYRGFLFFDTGSIPSVVIIISAHLSVWGYYDESEVDFYVVVQSGQPTYPHDPLVAGDYDRLHYSGNGGQFYTGDIDPATWETQYWNISLNIEGINMITKEGQTKFCLRSSRDIDGIAPPSPPNVMERIEIRSAEPTNRPRRLLLTVTYETVPPVPEFPIGLAFEILFIPVIIYILWRNKQRKKVLP